MNTFAQSLVACALLASTASAQDADDPNWGKPNMGLQVNLTLVRHPRAEESFVIHVRLRNIGSAPVALGEAKTLAAWLQVQQSEPQDNRLITQRAFPAASLKDFPAELAGGKEIDLGEIDLSAAGAYPHDMQRNVLRAYILGDKGPPLDDPPLRLVRALAVGGGKTYLTLFMPGEKPIALRSNIVDFTVVPADLSKLPEARQKELVDALIARFDAGGFAAAGAADLAAAYGKPAVPAMIAAVSDAKRKYDTRMWLTAALAGIPDDRAAAKLIDLLADGTVRSVVVYHGPKQRSGKLDAAILDTVAKADDGDLTALAILGFLVFRDQAPPALIEAGLASDNPKARAMVAKAMQSKANAFNLARLVALMKDKDDRVRAAAAASLGMMKQPSPAVLEALVASLSMDGEQSRQSACRALSDLAATDRPYDPKADTPARAAVIKAWQDWWKERQSPKP